MQRDINDKGHLTQNNPDIKVHASMCMVLNDVLKKVEWILPAIESARPGSRVGIQELCNINNHIDKGKHIIQRCTECSKLYLAMTGEANLSRCEKIRSSLCQSLCLIQTMVPTILASQISEIIDYISDAKFIINPSEEEAGKSLLELLHQPDSIEELESETFQFIAAKLDLTTPKSILIEKRSIKKFRESSSGGKDSKKDNVLKFFLYLIKKYAQKPNHNSNKTENNVSKPTNQVKLNSSNYTAQPPWEYICPISSKLMNDPVIISSGQTYEREYIEKWFKDGNDTCPTNDVKLDNFAIIPNNSMRDLIASWRKKHSKDKSQPSQSSQPTRNLIHEEIEEESKNESFNLSDNLQSQYSVSSLKDISTPLLRNKVGNIMFQRDNSNISFNSTDTSCILSESSRVFSITEGVTEKLHELFPWSEDFKNYGSFCNFNKDMFAKFLFDLSQLEMEIQTKAIEEFKIVVNGDEESFYSIVSNGFLEAIIEFLKQDQSDLNTGLKIFLAFLSNKRGDILSYLSDDLLDLFSSLLETEAKQEVVLILNKLTQINPNYISKIAESNLVLTLIQLLQIEEEIECLEQVLKILTKIANQIQDSISQMVSPNLISKLSLLLNEESLSSYCLNLMSNLSCKEETLELIISTNGCLALLCEFLDGEHQNEQEYSLNILLNICSNNFENCFLVLREGVIPALVHISVNGSEKGKGDANKLLFILRDLRYNNNNNNNNNSNSSINNDNNNNSEISIGSDLCSPTESVLEKEMDLNKEDMLVEEKPILKSSGFFARKMRFFSKPRLGH